MKNLFMWGFIVYTLVWLIWLTWGYYQLPPDMHIGQDYFWNAKNQGYVEYQSRWAFYRTQWLTIVFVPVAIVLLSIIGPLLERKR